MNKRQRKKHEPPELNITTFLNLMVVLIPFLLISAVFSRITIMELNVPTGAGGDAGKPNFSIEVIIRDSGLEVGVGAKVMAAIPKKDGRYDMRKLSETLGRLKAQYPEKEDATILMEPKIEYDYLIQIMDAVRNAEIPTPGSGVAQRVALFPRVSIGDAP
jgi:biopolymer transport protein ExbD